MAVYDNSYSRFVAWTKIVLPLAALGLLSTLFLFARVIDTEGALPFANVDVKEIAREQRLSEPRFAGITRDGAAIEIAATSARPSATDPGRVNGSDLTALVTYPEGATFALSSPYGEIDAGTGTAVLSGGVDMETSTGYMVKTSGLSASLEVTSMASHGKVDAEGPIGTLSAGQMDVALNNGRYLLVFKEGVRLVYDPRKGKERE